jgi:hypothetical protein
MHMMFYNIGCYIDYTALWKCFSMLVASELLKNFTGREEVLSNFFRNGMVFLNLRRAYKQICLGLSN